MDLFFQIFGIAGLLLITLGILTRRRKQQDREYILGGLFLLTYSWFLGDLIFIILQIIFILAALYDYFQKKKK